VTEDTRCDGDGAGTLANARTTVTLDFSGDARVPVATFERPADPTSLTELWLVLRQGLLHTDVRSYRIHAGPLCTMPDGLPYTLVRLRPAAPIAIGSGATDDVVISFDPDAQLERDAVRCSEQDVEECRTSDDPGDTDPDTRLRYTFAPEFPVRAAAPAP
jgi:hypothetical protein